MSHRYDEFLWELARGPILVSDAPSGLDGEMTCTGRYFEVTRTVIRLEYAGYQYRQGRRIPRPYVRVVMSCGHSHETTVGAYDWNKRPKTAVCYECSDAVPPIPDSGESYETDS